MIEIARIAHKVDIEISRRLNRLSTFTPSNDFLELRVRRLDLPARVLWISYLLVRINLDEVVVTLKYSPVLIRVVDALECLSVLNARVVLLLLLANIVFIEAWCVVDKRGMLSPAFRPSQGRRILTSKRAHEAEVVELAEVLACERCDRALIGRHIKFCGT